MSYRQLLIMLLDTIDYVFLQTDGTYDKSITHPVIDKVKYIKSQIYNDTVNTTDLINRAYKSASEDLRCGPRYWIYQKGYLNGVNEQDEISRAEEREEFVRAAQDWYRRMRNEPKDSQWHDEVERDCIDLRNFIDHKRGTCDSYVTDELHEAIEMERTRCINAAKKWLMDFLGETDNNHPTLESLQKTIEEWDA